MNISKYCWLVKGGFDGRRKSTLNKINEVNKDKGRDEKRKGGMDGSILSLSKLSPASSSSSSSTSSSFSS